MDLRSVLRNNVRKIKFVGNTHHEENLPKKSQENVVAEADVVLPETHEAEIKRRRYTAYMSDLGKNLVIF